MKYSDLTASELYYLASHGSPEAMQCLKNRASKEDPEARYYLSEAHASLDGEFEMYPAANYGGWEGVFIGDAAPPPSVTFTAPNFVPPSMTTSAAPGAPVPAGASPAFPQYGFSPGGFPIMPHQVIAQAIQNATSRRSPTVVRNVAPGRRPAVRPPQPRMPKWGVFIDYEQQPIEVFDTLAAANAYAQSVPQGIPVAVIHAGGEPPRAPYGYVSQLQPAGDLPYSSLDYGQDIQAGPSLSTYQLYQLQQGQRI